VDRTSNGRADALSRPNSVKALTKRKRTTLLLEKLFVWALSVTSKQEEQEDEQLDSKQITKWIQVQHDLPIPCLNPGEETETRFDTPITAGPVS
jgi:hypothetical protein